MSDKEKLELGIYLFNKITDYDYENCDNVNEVLIKIFSNLKYELEILEYSESYKRP